MMASSASTWFFGPRSGMIRREEEEDQRVALERGDGEANALLNGLTRLHGNYMMESNRILIKIRRELDNNPNDPFNMRVREILTQMGRDITGVFADHNEGAEGMDAFVNESRRIMHNELYKPPEWTPDAFTFFQRHIEDILNDMEGKGFRTEAIDQNGKTRYHITMFPASYREDRDIPFVDDYFARKNRGLLGISDAYGMDGMSIQLGQADQYPRRGQPADVHGPDRDRAEYKRMEIPYPRPLRDGTI